MGGLEVRVGTGPLRVRDVVPAVVLANAVRHEPQVVGVLDAHGSRDGAPDTGVSGARAPPTGLRSQRRVQFGDGRVTGGHVTSSPLFETDSLAVEVRHYWPLGPASTAALRSAMVGSVALAFATACSRS